MWFCKLSVFRYLVSGMLGLSVSQFKKGMVSRTTTLSSDDHMVFSPFRGRLDFTLYIWKFTNNENRNLLLFYYFSGQLVLIPVLSIYMYIYIYIFFSNESRKKVGWLSFLPENKFMRQCRLKYVSHNQICPYHVELLSEVRVNVNFFLCIFALAFLLLFSTLVPPKLSKFLKHFLFQGTV